MRSGIGWRRLRAPLLLSGGLAASAFFVWRSGVSGVIDSLLAVGLRGLFAGAAVHLAAVALCTVAWIALAADAPARPGWRFFLLGRVMRDVGGELLPMVPLGELFGIRQLVVAGMSAARATAATIADITVELATQLAAASLIILALGAGHHAWHGLGGSALTGAGLPLIALLLVQRSGGTALSALVGDAGVIAGIAGFWDRVAAALRRVYARRPHLAAASAAHLAGWVLGGLETWVVLRAGGIAVGIIPAIALEIATCGLRNVSPVPAGAGVQEGGYLLLGGLIGLPPDAAIALSLTRRARTLLFAAAILPAWWHLRSRQPRPLPSRVHAAALAAR